MKVARVEKDISQEQLAEKIGVSRQTIGMIEAGKFNPSLQLCIAICKELGKTLNDLFWEEQRKNKYYKKNDNRQDRENDGTRDAMSLRDVKTEYTIQQIR